MPKIGIDYPQEPRKTALYEAEEWYQHFLAEKLGRDYQPIKRSNFGQYLMAVNYLTSVVEESKAVEKLAVFNIDHMSQIQFSGRDAARLLDRVLPINVSGISVGQCKYTLLLSEEGTVLDDLIMMKTADDEFILVINAGHDITDRVIIDGREEVITSDADYIMSYLKEGEEVTVEDISAKLVKIDVQGPYSYKLISTLYGNEVLRSRNNPKKNMSFFTFNEMLCKGCKCYLSRTGYTNRWGWEMYFPKEIAAAEFKRIIETAFSYGGLLVGLGGRDENRISAGNCGLPLYGHEYDKYHTPTNAPLFSAAIELDKDDFVGKKSLLKDAGNDKRMVLFITEGIVTGRGIYLDGKRIGTVTSSINSPNIPSPKRAYLESQRKSVNEENGIAAIGLGWVKENPYKVDSEGKDIQEKDGVAVRIRVDFYREDNSRNPVGNPVKGYISADGVNPATAPKPLKHIEQL